MTATDPTPTITPDMQGCWFAGASHRTADELCVAVIGAALHYGWSPEDKADLEALDVNGWFDDPDLSQYASDAVMGAESYLNDMAPDGYLFGFEEGFYLLPCCAWEGYDPRHDAPCPHGDDCPNAPLTYTPGPGSIAGRAVSGRVVWTPETGWSDNAVGQS